MSKLIVATILFGIFAAEFAMSAGFRFGGLKLDVASTTTAGTTTTLTASSSQVQAFSGSSNQSVVFPNATTLTPGYWYTVSNEGSGTVTVKDGGSGTLLALTASQSALFALKATASSIGSWDIQKGAGGAAATVYLRTVRVGFGTTSRRTGCSGATCTLFDQMDNYGLTDTVSSITRDGTGDYNINFTAGRCSVAPACSYLSYRECTGSVPTVYQSGADNTTTVVQLTTDTVGAVNGCGDVICTCAP